MRIFAAGNEFVTIILALIPLAVFLLSNLFKASQKPANPPAKAQKPNNNGGAVPGTVDLDSFLREAKKRKAQAQSSPPPPPPVAPRPVVQSQSKPQNRPTKPVQPSLPQPKPMRQEKQREVPTQNPRPRQEKKTPSTQGPAVAAPQLSAALASEDLLERGKARPVLRPKAGLSQSPVAAAVELVRSGRAAPTSFVLQEIFGRPRCVRPFQLPEPSAGNTPIP
jgi:outer membrane biosynthesis protein TonB